MLGPRRFDEPAPAIPYRIVRIQTTDPIEPAEDAPMTDVQGFFYPRTATGRSSLIPPPPWYYSGDLLTVEYRTDPARVAELLPAPLAPGRRGPRRGRADLGRLAVLLDQPRGAAGPGARQYKEAFVVVRCSFEGRTYSRCVYIWVDKDFAIGARPAPGLPEEARLDLADPAAPVRPGRAADRRRAAGSARTLAAADRRLAEAVVTLREPSRRPTASSTRTRWRTTGGCRRSRRARRTRFAELIASGAREFEGGQAWRGDATLRAVRLARPRNWHRLEVDEIIGGYYRQVGVTWDGGRSLARLEDA